MSAPLASSLPNFDEIASWRRGIFFFIMALLTTGGALVFIHGQENFGSTVLDYLLLLLFVLLFSQITTGFVLAIMGFFLTIRGNKVDFMKPLPPLQESNGEPLPSTAIILPIYNEKIERIAAGVRNMWQSLNRTGHLGAFDFYLLSDSTDPDCWIEEEAAWAELVRELGAAGHLFYRKRRKAINKKSGNVADFCRRWGNHYRYMIVLDADSIMTGPTMVRLVQAMEADPRIGLIQTVPRMVLGKSIFRRVLQFTMNLCGPMFSEGLGYWQMNGANYWGHNAIVRMAPFIEYCALPDLPVTDPTDRHILSHDTIEAALMRKAGYGVWLAPSEAGSFEEGPPTLTDMLARDRRWCKGNLQHVWFLFARGFNFASRLHIWMGLMAYMSSPLWFLFLALGSWNIWIKQHYYLSITRPESNSLSHFFVFTAISLLVVPKLLGWLAALPRAVSYGGLARFTMSVVLEILFSVVLAPTMMVYHSVFVIQAIAGLVEKWDTQNRSDVGLTWSQCLRTYGWVSLLGLVSAGVVWVQLPGILWWVSPVLVPWILSVPFAKWSSSPQWGEKLRRWKLFLVPEEVNPPLELHGLENHAVRSRLAPSIPTVAGLARALLHPMAHARHLALLRQWGRKERETPKHINRIVRKALTLGPENLKRAEQYLLLWDIGAVTGLHQQLWERPGAQLPAGWNREFAKLAAESATIVASTR